MTFVYFYFYCSEKFWIFNNIKTFVVATLLVISPGSNGMLVAKTVPLSYYEAGISAVCGFVGAFYVHDSGSFLVFCLASSNPHRRSKVCQITSLQGVLRDNNEDSFS